jgi:hypothetical protein
MGCYYPWTLFAASPDLSQVWTGEQTYDGYGGVIKGPSMSEVYATMTGSVLLLCEIDDEEFRSNSFSMGC